MSERCGQSESDDPKSPTAGTPTIEAYKARAVIVNK